jgi:hypothetical protein
MKLSKPLCALILIALVLPLSAASDETPSVQSRESPIQQSNSARSQGNPQDGEAQSHQTYAQTIPSPARTSAITPAIPRLPSATEETRYGKKQSKGWREKGFGPATWSNWALTVLAGAAAWIAIWTLGAINRQADIAEQSLTLIEAPYLSVKMQAHILQSGARIFEPAPYPKVEYWFRNDGRTVALLVEECAMLRVYADLPKQPEYYGINPIGVGLAHASDTLHWNCSGTNFDLDKEAKYSAFINGQTKAYFFGFIRFDDLFETRRTYAYCWQYIPSSAGFIVAGGKSYNYLTAEKKNDKKTPRLKRLWRKLRAILKRSQWRRIVAL